MFAMWTSASDADSAGDADDAATLNAPKSSKTDSRQRPTHTRTYKIIQAKTQTTHQRKDEDFPPKNHQDRQQATTKTYKNTQNNPSQNTNHSPTQG